MSKRRHRQKKARAAAFARLKTRLTEAFGSWDFVKAHLHSWHVVRRHHGLVYVLEQIVDDHARAPTIQQWGPSKVLEMIDDAFERRAQAP